MKLLFPLRIAGSCLLLAASTAHAAADLPLLEAARKGDRTAVKALIAKRVDVNITAPDGTTALLSAARHDDVPTAELLIQAGANVNAANDYGVTPLWTAALNGSAAMLTALLKAGANPNVVRLTGETVLMRAALTGNLEAVKVLVDAGVDLNTAEATQGQTALMWAVAGQHLEVVRALIDKGSDVRGRSKSKFTPLMFAARDGNLALGRFLLSRGAEVNEAAGDGTSALHVAVVRGHVPFAELLLEHGADPNAGGPGYTPLHWTVWHAASRMSTDVKVESGEWSAMGGIPTREGKLRLFNALVARGADVNARVTRRLPLGVGAFLGGGSVAGATPFFLATDAGDVQFMRLLLARGADPRITATNGTTPLMVAAGLMSTPNEGLVEESQRLTAAQLCVELGADVNAANTEGNTAVHATAIMGNDSVLQLLLDRGAKVNPRNKKGDTPFKYSKGYHFLEAILGGGHVTTVELLKKHGGID